jgi:hypothetical protein
MFVFIGFQSELNISTLKLLTNLFVCCVLKNNIYPKSVTTTILPNKYVFNGVTINNNINITDNPRHILTCCVILEKSLIMGDKLLVNEYIVKIYLYFIFIFIYI